MSKKLTVTKDIVDAIDHLRNNLEYSFDDFMRVKSEGNWKTREALPLNHISIETLANLLINGYELSKTPEENVRDYYQNCQHGWAMADNENHTLSAEHLNGQVLGIRLTLDYLGIKIEGVNG